RLGLQSPGGAGQLRPAGAVDVAGRGPGALLAGGLGALALALLLAFGLAAWRRLAPGGAEEQFVARVAVALGIAGLAPAGLVLLRSRGRPSAGALALVLLTTLAVVLVAVYFYAVADAVRFPADVLLWSEGEYAS